ncbi:MAG: hypothetical protein VB106_12600 [Clostridiaceae bacterium]|nr:hypothetical protein [Clostridiaceae bacterium]
MENKSVSVYQEEFIPYIMKWGQRTNLIGAAIGFTPLLALILFFDITPSFSAMAGAFLTVAASEGVMWFMEPISFFPVLGIPATYMSFLSGNVSNLRLPCASAAQKAAETKAGTPEADIAATLGIGMSIILNIIILFIGALFGSQIISGLPENVTSTLNYMLPALFGALWTMLAAKRLLMGVIGLALGIGVNLLCNMGILPFWLVTLTSVVGTILIGIVLYKNGVKILGKED